MKSSENANHVQLTTCLFGFILALILTLLAFGLVIVGTDVPLNSVSGLFDAYLPYGQVFMKKIPRQSIVTSIFILAVAQILIHLRYFLHLGLSSSQRWNTLAVLFTLFILVIMAGGTLWIIFSLNGLMMGMGS